MERTRIIPGRTEPDAGAGETKESPGALGCLLDEEREEAEIEDAEAPIDDAGLYIDASDFEDAEVPIDDA